MATGAVSYFVADCGGTVWHVADGLDLRPRCEVEFSVSSRVPVIDLMLFSASRQVCLVCEPNVAVPVSDDDKVTTTGRGPQTSVGVYVQAELALGVGSG